MIRTMRTNSIKFMAAAVCVALSFVSCQNGNDADDSSLIFLKPEFQNAAGTQTRAMASGDYQSYTPQNGDKILAFTYYVGDPEDKESPLYGIQSGNFTFTDGEWNSTVGCEQDADIDIYSIMPADIASASMTTNGTLTLGSMKIISGKDVMYSVAAAKTQADLTEGTFHVEDIHLPTPAEPEEDKVWFAMDHMFAKGNLKIKGDAKYLGIRTIEITKVTVTSTTGYSSATVTYGNPTTVELGTTYGSGNVNVETMTGKKNLTSDFQNFGTFYFMPKKDIPVSLSVTYNVYTVNTDGTGEPVLTRENQTAVSSGLIKADELSAGVEHDIYVTVKPTYMYVMADVDGQLKLTIE